MADAQLVIDKLGNEIKQLAINIAVLQTELEEIQKNQATALTNKMEKQEATND